MYNKPDPIRELMFHLSEMEFLEKLIIEETSEAAEQTNNDMARDTFSRWARESSSHRQTLQRLTEKLGSEVSTKSAVRGLGMLDLRDIALMHLNIEGDAEKKYTQMAEMSYDEEVRKTFRELARAENRHHQEARLLVDSINQLIDNSAKKNV